MTASTLTANAPVLTLDDVRAAAARIDGHVVRTPTLYSKTLSAMTGADIWLKFENLQFTAAYKERGALNALLLLSDEQRARGVIAASAGNHAQGLSYHGTRLGVPVTIVMPRTTPTVKITQTESVGGKVVLEGETFDEAYAHARVMEAELGLTFVHPFDHPHVAAGQGTVALEMLADVPDLDMLAVPIGGGGLLTGMGTAARGINPAIGLIGVQAQLFPSMYNRLKHAELPCGGDTLAEGIAVKEPGAFTSATLAGLVDDIVLVDEPHLEQAVSLLLQIEKTVVEGAGAAGLAAVLADPGRFRGRTVGLVLCGGNIDTRLLASVLTRQLAREGRLSQLRFELVDRPGQLATVVAVLSQSGANVVEVSHHRTFTELPAKAVLLEVVIETRDQAHLAATLAALRAAKLDVEVGGQ